jgi:hypothetical protein
VDSGLEEKALGGSVESHRGVGRNWGKVVGAALSR